VDPHEFVAEVYRRMSLRHRAERPAPSWAQVKDDSRVLQAVRELRALLSLGLLPDNRQSAILEIGFGEGWFLAACLQLGYTNLSGADFGVAGKAYIEAWAPGAITLWEIENDTGTFLSRKSRLRPTTLSTCHTSLSTFRSILCFLWSMPCTAR
jgi:hypothetical protein